ncbi:uncharacterized protein A4U43_C02F2970 [Asparagus officinalis]|uniref:Bulb-type lectin domain-containing protein n=1 Tax=Asparagus officinalis TaxID=4686 RepID=A0A5P1FI44_ASPOF|nr:uncharacterized protein A4U43_C02F2970 [Asparagus officinalis]
MIPFPPMYEDDFKASARFLDSDDIGMNRPSFKAALSVEAINGDISCFLAVLLGDVKVWGSDHFMKFWADGACVIELTQDGDLQVQDRNGHVGWSSGTSGLGVKSLELQKRSGNLILIDTKNRTRWQSFDYPTDNLLWSQQLNASTRLTTPVTSSPAFFYSLEIRSSKLTLCLNFEDQKYSYWEFKPQRKANISFIRLGSRGLKLFNRNSTKIGQILETDGKAVRFLALEKTGNLKLYHARKSYTNLIVFESSYQAIDNFCNLPLPCGFSRVCTRNINSTCLDLPETQKYSGFCDRSFKMVELEGVDTVLRKPSQMNNLTKDECSSSCTEDCSCAAALYAKQKCYHYGLIAGAREVGRGSESSFWVKVEKGRHGISTSLMNKILLIGEVANVLAICCIVGGILYWVLKIRQKRRGNSGTDSN